MQSISCILVHWTQHKKILELVSVSVLFENILHKIIVIVFEKTNKQRPRGTRVIRKMKKVRMADLATPT